MYNKEHWKADPTLFFTPLSMMNRNHTLCRHLYVVCRNRNMNVLQKYSILYQYPQTFQTSVNSNFLWSFLGPTKRIFACINIHNLMYLHDIIQFFYCPFIYWIFFTDSSYSLGRDEAPEIFFNTRQSTPLTVRSSWFEWFAL